MGTTSHTTDNICGEGADLNQPSVSGSDNAQLLAIVEVERDQRVRCGNPGCGHSVYKAIHVVQDGPELFVLGSTCFDKRYGSGGLGTARYGGGAGRTLTTEEREMLLTNTAALLARFEAELDAQRQKLQALRDAFEASVAARRHPPSHATAHPSQVAPLASNRGPDFGSATKRSAPWAWMKPQTSMAGFKLRDGSGWVRVQRRDGQQMLVPWPIFDGWDEWLPAHLGQSDHEFGAYQVRDIQSLVAYLRVRSSNEKISGIWSEIAAVLSAT